MSAVEEGSRVELLSCTDRYTDLTPGALGTVRFDRTLWARSTWTGTGAASWAWMPDEDRWRVVSPPPPRHGSELSVERAGGQATA